MKSLLKCPVHVCFMAHFTIKQRHCVSLTLTVSPQRFHPQTDPPLVFGDLSIFLYFWERICLSPLRAPGYTAAQAKSFICDYKLFESALPCSLCGHLSNTFIIPHKK